uniref:Homeobox domain-containing protein n=1 Tax=Heterorhabditis bacteriophora TaxID=37862 RepID=A0A1I7XSK9_HETBA
MSCVPPVTTSTAVTVTSAFPTLEGNLDICSDDPLLLKITVLNKKEIMRDRKSISRVLKFFFPAVCPTLLETLAALQLPLITTSLVTPPQPAGMELLVQVMIQSLTDFLLKSNHFQYYSSILKLNITYFQSLGISPLLPPIQLPRSPDVSSPSDVLQSPSLSRSPLTTGLALPTSTALYIPPSPSTLLPGLVPQTSVSLSVPASKGLAPQLSLRLGLQSNFGNYLVPTGSETSQESSTLSPSYEMGPSTSYRRQSAPEGVLRPPIPNERRRYSDFSVQSLLHPPPEEDVEPKRTSTGRKQRTIYGLKQTEVLEEAFHSQRYMVGAEREMLAARLGLSEAQVRVWFQNRRSKHRKMTKMAEQEQKEI